MSAAPCPAAECAQRPRWEVADVFRLYGEAYRRAHSPPAAHIEVMHAIETCRTAERGGHLERCDACGFERIAYNSCRNRHCPKCQSLAKAKWLEARERELLPAQYFHAVFTLPHDLNPLALSNKTLVYGLLFRAAAESLQEFGRDPDHGLGGKLGFTAILHTWDQQLNYHVHLHCLIPGGALSPDGQHWTHARDGFLFPVRQLSEVFRGKFLAYLAKAFRAGHLQFPGKTAHLGTPGGFQQLTQRLCSTPWVVYTKASFPQPANVLDYLARYTHRVALSNHRISNVANGQVSFSYRDRKNRGAKKTLTLAAHEFIRRFLLHVLPKGFTRIRHFGFLASRSKARDLPRCRHLLGKAPELPAPEEKTTLDLLTQLTGTDLTRCPHCQRGAMHFFRVLLPLHPGRPDACPPLPCIQDSS
jgi:predicted Zn-ribbon and HTH transcriptional regulator